MFHCQLLHAVIQIADLLAIILPDSKGAKCMFLIFYFRIVTPFNHCCLQRVIIRMIDDSLNNSESLALNSTSSCHSSTGNIKNLCRWTVIENIAEKEALKTSGLNPLTSRSD